MDMFQLIRSKYGRFDVCINNAGVVTKKSLTEGSTEEWREMFDVSVFQPRQGLLNIFFIIIIIVVICPRYNSNNELHCRRTLGETVKQH